MKKEFKPAFDDNELDHAYQQGYAAGKRFTGEPEGVLVEALERLDATLKDFHPTPDLKSKISLMKLIAEVLK